MKRTMPVQLLTRYIRDAQFRSLAGIYIGLTVDILYAAFRAIVGLRYGSRWFLSMAVYYAVLGICLMCTMSASIAAETRLA